MAARNVETREQLLRRTKLKERTRIQGEIRPYFGFLQEYNSSADACLVDSHGGRRTLFNPQPHLGRTAWIRVAPEGGMGSLLITRSDSQEPEVMRWWHTDTQARLRLYRDNVQALSAGNGQLSIDEAFRVIESGEVDIASRGGSQIFMGNRPNMDLRAGVIRFTMDQDEAETSIKAPTHIRRGHQHKSSEIGDEERFGVVKRPEPGSLVKSFYVDPDGLKGEAREGKGFAKEYLMRLSNPQGSGPSVLFDLRVGHVMDDQGKPYKLNGTKLRYRAEYFTVSDTSTLVQLDEKGNFSVECPSEASTGGRLVLPSGHIRAEIGKNFERTVNGNEVANIRSSRTEDIRANETKTVGGNSTITITGNDIKIVQSEATETVTGKKTVRVVGNYTAQCGETTKVGLTPMSHAVEADVVTILATREIIFEAPIITFNTPIANFTGKIRTEEFATNTGIVTPDGTRGRAGVIPPKPALRTVV